MFASAPRIKVSAIASAFKANRRHQSPGEFALTALQVVVLAVTVLLFVAWLTPSNSRRATIWGSAPESNCVSSGKGGAYCAGNSAIDDRSRRSIDSDEDCVSLGRGGLLCKERLGNADRPS